MKIHRLTPYTFKNGQGAKNRVVVPPMASQTADEDGVATRQTVEHYARLARSGAGLIFVEYSFVHLSGKGEPHQLGASTEVQLSGLQAIASVLHESSALAGLQLVHVGGKTDRTLTGGPLMGPSAVPVPVKGWEPEAPEPMSESDVQEWIETGAFIDEILHSSKVDFAAVGRAILADPEGWRAHHLD